MALIIRNYRKILMNSFIGKHSELYNSDIKLGVNSIIRIIPRRHCHYMCANFSKSITSKAFNADSGENGHTYSNFIYGMNSIILPRRYCYDACANVTRNIAPKPFSVHSGDNGHTYSHFIYGMTFIPAGILSIFGKKEEPEESELIMTIKRGILLIERGEFKKAEQMLHLALKMAQEQQNEEGVTHIYDLLANLALEQQEFSKAEKLFVSVMQRLVAQGVPQTDNRIIHMSLKLANIYMHQNDPSKAEEGYKFCTRTLKANVDNGDDDENTILLYAISNDYYAKFLVGHNRLPEAFACFKKAYELNLQVNGELHEETVVLLNDLGTICIVQDEYDKAISYLNHAVSIGDKLPEMKDFGYVLANLVAAYIKKGMYEEAKKLCIKAWQNAKKHNNEDILKELSHYFDEIKEFETTANRNT